jgi:uncharacterized protein
MNTVQFDPMPNLPWLYREATGAVIIRVHLVPNAARTEIDGLHDGALKLRLHAPPVDGKANDALVRWLATTLGVGRNQIVLVRGHTSRRKELRVSAEAASTARWNALDS